MRRVSWNFFGENNHLILSGHASHEACELKFLFRCVLMSDKTSRLAWGVWVEIKKFPNAHLDSYVTPRMRRVSWNHGYWIFCPITEVTPRMRRVSWNESAERHSIFCKPSRLAWGVWVEILFDVKKWHDAEVTPRMRRVSWNHMNKFPTWFLLCHASHEACELKL